MVHQLWPRPFSSGSTLLCLVIVVVVVGGGGDNSSGCCCCCCWRRRGTLFFFFLSLKSPLSIIAVLAMESISISFRSTWPIQLQRLFFKNNFFFFFSVFCCCLFFAIKTRVSSLIPFLLALVEELVTQLLLMIFLGRKILAGFPETGSRLLVWKAHSLGMRSVMHQHSDPLGTVS